MFTKFRQLIRGRVYFFTVRIAAFELIARKAFSKYR
jgi:hypothetical protein